MTGTRVMLAAALAAAILPYFIGLGTTSIVDANEAYYTETPREMMEAGDCLNPTFNYEPRFNKPPLSYWVVAGFYELFGISLWSARLPIALGAMVMLATVFFLGRLAFSTDAGLVAALTLAVTPRMLLFSRRIIIDVYTAMFCGLTLLFFALAEFRPARRRLWLILMYAAVGLGVLTKGPVNAVVPALAFLVYLAVAGRLSAIRRLMLPFGTLIVAVIVVPYYLALYVQHGWTHISSFIFTENIGRFAEGAGGPSRGVFFYVPVVLADLYFPWSLLLPVALALVPWRRVVAPWGRRRPAAGTVNRTGPVREAGDLRLLLALWVVVIAAFFSLSRAQQDLYVLPFVAGAAPLVGGLLHDWVAGSMSRIVTRASGTALLVTSLSLGSLGLLSAWYLGDARRPFHLEGALAAGVLLATGGLVGAYCTVRRARLAGFAALAVSLVCAHWIVVLRALPDYERYKHVPQLSRVIQARAVPGSDICTYKLATPSLVFLLRQHVFLLEDEAALRRLMQATPALYCMMREGDYEAVRGTLGVQTAVLGQVAVAPSRWQDYTNRAPLPRVVLVTNRSSGGP
jgi:4-amino-4-deoxy-L-arabinose transferase-like glycosyltransferase